MIVASGRVEVVRPADAAGPAPEGVSTYDASILAALGVNAVSSRRFARAAGRRHNSYFRERLALLVEAGRVRRTRRGYSRPAG